MAREAIDRDLAAPSIRDRELLRFRDEVEIYPYRGVEGDVFARRKFIVPETRRDRDAVQAIAPKRFFAREDDRDLPRYLPQVTLQRGRRSNRQEVLIRPRRDRYRREENRIRS